MANTGQRGYPKPVDEHFVSDDVYLLIQALDMIDADIAALLTSVSGRALTIHAHAIGDITGLAAALAGKSDTGHIHALADLSDTLGLALAPEGYVIVKGAGGKWVPLSPATLFTAHSHAISDVTNLQAALDGKLTAAALAAATAKGTPVDADTIPLSDSAATGALKRLSWASLKATLKAYFDGLYQSAGSYAAAVHTHAISAITGLQTALDGKAAASHTHAFEDITNRPTTLADYGIANVATIYTGTASSEANYPVGHIMIRSHTVAANGIVAMGGSIQGVWRSRGFVNAVDRNNGESTTYSIGLVQRVS